MKNKSELIKGINGDANVIVHKPLPCDEETELVTQKG